MISDWLVVIPAWGGRCLRTVDTATAPAALAAAQRMGGHFRVWMPSNNADDIANASGLPLDRLVFDTSDLYGQLRTIHCAALHMAHDGEYVAFINGDMVPSLEVFEAAERHFAQGKKMIMMAATRTMDVFPPIGEPSAKLLRWTMQHRHPLVKECFWGYGRSSFPATLYFQRDDNIVCRGFLLHPFAVVKESSRAYDFGGQIDGGMVTLYQPDEIHVVTDPNEAAFAESSPPERRDYLLPHVMTPEDIARWAHRRTQFIHRWFFRHRIIIQGDGRDVGDEDVCSQILEMLKG